MKNVFEWVVGVGVVGACLVVSLVLFGFVEMIFNVV